MATQLGISPGVNVAASAVGGGQDFGSGRVVAARMGSGGRLTGQTRRAHRSALLPALSVWKQGNSRVATMRQEQRASAAPTANMRAMSLALPLRQAGPASCSNELPDALATRVGPTSPLGGRSRGASQALPACLPLRQTHFAALARNTHLPDHAASRSGAQSVHRCSSFTGNLPPAQARGASAGNTGEDTTSRNRIS